MWRKTARTSENDREDGQKADAKKDMKDLKRDQRDVKRDAKDIKHDRKDLKRDRRQRQAGK